MHKSTWMLAAGLLAILSVGGCSSPAEKAYKACKTQFSAAIEKTRADAKGGAAAKPMLDAGIAMMESMSESTCTAVRKACEDDPKGQMCQAALQSFDK